MGASWVLSILANAISSRPHWVHQCWFHHMESSSGDVMWAGHRSWKKGHALSHRGKYKQGFGLPPPPWRFMFLIPSGQLANICWKNKYSWDGESFFPTSCWFFLEWFPIIIFVSASHSPFIYSSNIYWVFTVKPGTISGTGIQSPKGPDSKVATSEKLSLSILSRSCPHRDPIVSPWLGCLLHYSLISCVRFFTPF